MGTHLAAKNEDNLWVAFRILKEALGATTYRESVRDILEPASNRDVPTSYRHLWKLRLAGILNLNLDRLASRAFALEHLGATDD